MGSGLGYPAWGAVMRERLFISVVLDLGRFGPVLLGGYGRRQGDRFVTLPPFACCSVLAPVRRATCCDGVRERQHTRRTMCPAVSSAGSEFVRPDCQYGAGGVEQDALDGASEDELAHHGPVPESNDNYFDAPVLGDLDYSVPRIGQD